MDFQSEAHLLFIVLSVIAVIPDKFVIQVNYVIRVGHSVIPQQIRGIWV